MASLMQSAQSQQPVGQAFQKPNIAAVLAKLTPQVRDAVDRTVAAGMKLMYAPESKAMRDKAMQSPDPIPKKLAENVVGLLLLIDSKANGGVPVEALFPATLELMVEAANLLQAAGQTVSQQDFNNALLAAHALISKKLGASHDQMIGSAQETIGGGQAPDPNQAPAQGPQAMPAQGAQPMPSQPDPNQQQVMQ